MGLRCGDQGPDWDQSPRAEPSGPPLMRRQQPPSESLKCPRCGSDNTKFCYYNNYNKSQPRHFCKSCKRHWTKGGTLRNVPVGGGGRKSKRPRNSNAAVEAATATAVSGGFPEPPRRQDCVGLLQSFINTGSDNESMSGNLYQAFVGSNTSRLHEAARGVDMIAHMNEYSSNLDENSALINQPVNDLIDRYPEMNFDSVEESSGSDMISAATWPSLSMGGSMDLSGYWNWNWNQNRNGIDDVLSVNSSDLINIAWDDVYAETKP